VNQDKITHPSGEPSYRWIADAVDFKDLAFIYKTVEMHDAVLIDVAQDGRIIGVECYGGELTIDDFARILADPRVRFKKEQEN
jgi:uncharacterized protein YuzE